MNAVWRKTSLIKKYTHAQGLRGSPWPQNSRALRDVCAYAQALQGRAVLAWGTGEWRMYLRTRDHHHMAMMVNGISYQIHRSGARGQATIFIRKIAIRSSLRTNPTRPIPPNSALLSINQVSCPNVPASSRSSDGSDGSDDPPPPYSLNAPSAATPSRQSIQTSTQPASDPDERPLKPPF